MRKRDYKKEDKTESIQERMSVVHDKRGIEHYFTPDPNNLIDQEILKRIRGNDIHLGLEERKCRIILSRRLHLGGIYDSKDKTRIDDVIFSAIKSKCKKQNRLWTDVVREVFCIHFNIK